MGPPDPGLVPRAHQRDARAEKRDRRAETRDLEADERDAAGPAAEGAAADRRQAALDRVHAGQDRDAAAGDRHDLLSLVGRLLDVPLLRRAPLTVVEQSRRTIAQTREVIDASRRALVERGRRDR